MKHVLFKKEKIPKVHLPPTQLLQELSGMKDSSELAFFLYRYGHEWPSGQILQSSQDTNQKRNIDKIIFSVGY